MANYSTCVHEQEHVINCRCKWFDGHEQHKCDKTTILALLASVVQFLAKASLFLLCLINQCQMYVVASSGCFCADRWTDGQMDKWTDG